MWNLFDNLTGIESVGDKLVTNLKYAGDSTLLVNSKEKIKVLLHHLETTSSNLGLTINKKNENYDS